MTDSEKPVDTTDAERHTPKVEAPKTKGPASAATSAAEQYALLYPDGFPPGHFLG